MKKLYMITGADGHLAKTIIKQLKEKKEQVKGLILSGQTQLEEGVWYYEGNMKDKESLKGFFKDTSNYERIIIHAAGIISIADKVSKELYEVNVIGTKNLIEVCLEEGVSKFVYVSSVHAIPEKDGIITEVSEFSPDKVHGGYAKTKAMASQFVMEAVKKGLPAVIVHPSGIIGPNGGRQNHLIQLVEDYKEGKIPACVKGGYDFVDVRDVAQGCIAAAEKGKIGECYILSNRYYTIRELFNIIDPNRKVPTLPMWLAKLSLPILELYAKVRKKRPLYTRYSLYTLQSKSHFSHEKATKTLEYQPHPIGDSPFCP